MGKPQTKRILVVDDEECIAESLVLILRNFGYEATGRNDGQSALEECEIQAPDLVISDVMMPELNGIELAIQIEERCQACRILLISGMGSSIALLEEASQKGHCFEIMSKPIHPSDLLARIKAVLAEEKPSQIVKAPVTRRTFQAPMISGI